MKKEIEPVVTVIGEGDSVTVEPIPPISLDDTPTVEQTLMERVLWVRDRVTTLGKDSQVGNQYKAISHDKVTAFIRPKMVQAGIFHYVYACEAEDNETGAVTDKGRKIVQHKAKFIIRFIAVNNRTDFFDVIQYAYADDFGDKAPGKATSYAMKYSLLKMFMVETGEEDEERVAEDGGRVGVIEDSESMSMELYATAEELFGDDCKEMLKAMAQRRFFVTNYGEIPQDRFADAMRSLRVKKASLTENDNE